MKRKARTIDDADLTKIARNEESQNHTRSTKEEECHMSVNSSHR